MAKNRKDWKPAGALVREEGKNETWRYDDVSSFLSDCYDLPARCTENQDKGAAYWKDGGGGILGHGREWFGFPALDKNGDHRLTVAELRDTLQNYTDGVDKAAEMADKLREKIAQPMSIKRRRIRCDFGDSIDMQAVYAGRLDTAWQRCGKVQQRCRRNLIVGVDQIEYGGGDASRIFWRGAAALALSDVLSAAGYSVELRACFRGGNDCGSQGVSITVKQPDMPLDILATAGPMTHPAFFRACGHQWLMNFCRNRRSGGGVMVQRWEKLPDGEIIAPQDVCTEAGALDWVSQQIRVVEQSEQELLAA